MVKKDSKLCKCPGGFPTFPVIVLVIGVLWFLSGIGIITIDIPWFPLVIIIVALGMIINRHGGH